uniref:Rab1a n=1 Tax=Trepomonas sp. PC1 TaxID=1076344 RepID=A0A146KAD1_9EUKA|eukprot:JAP93793.1 Rab1a [Trepomonas sp. PC1]
MDYLFKVLIIGDSNVGKSSILVRYADDEFYSEYISTIGVDYRIKSLTVNNQLQRPIQIKIQVWDTAGQEKFDNIARTYYRGTHGIFLVFDVSNRDSFQNIQKWLQKVAGINAIKILIGAKIDLKRIVKKEEAEEFANSQGMKYIETSSKTGDNIQEAFLELGRGMLGEIQTDFEDQLSQEQILVVEEKKRCC